MTNTDQPSRPRSPRTLAAALVLLAIGASGGCGGDKSTPPQITTRLKPTDVVDQLQTAYRTRDAALYARLLADEFTFDPYWSGGSGEVPEFWSRLPDSTCTARLFQAPDIDDVRATLTYAPDVTVNEVGRAGWRRVRIVDAFVEVDQVPPTGEILTYRVDGDAQDFYMRRGRSAADTLATSPTAQEWFLVEWRDLGRLQTTSGPAAAESPTPVRATTWSDLKKLCAP